MLQLFVFYFLNQSCMFGSMRNVMTLFILLFGVVCYSAAQEIKVVTWNIFLRPAFLLDKQIERVDSIAAHLLSNNYDVIALQEVFHRKARKRLISQLDSCFPYYLEPERSGVFKINSGLMTFSRYPIIKDKHTFYSNLIAADKLSSKGLQMAHVMVGGDTLLIANTHLQAGTEDRFQEARVDEYLHIREMLRGKVIAVVLLGDLNTDKNNTTRHEVMLCKLKFIDGQILNREIGSANLANQELFFAEEGGEQVLDYILSSTSPASNISIKNRNIKCFRSKWNGKLSNLSDHNAVEAIIIL
jgi:endonuclease/exonuclease/phosphatase family metal-dependent hydrolase